MRLQLLARLGVAALVGLIAGCSSAPVNPAAPPPLPPLTGDALLSLQEIDSARALYLAKCAKCHKFYHPASYADAEWQTWMRKMSKKARLKPDQDELISRYLGLFRTGVGTKTGAASGAVE